MVRPPLEILMDFVDTHGQQADLLGRSDYIGTYHHTSYGSSAAKQAEREKVLDFMLGVASEWNGKSLKVLSFPGIEWLFERLMLARRPDAQFVGLEHSVTAYTKSRAMIPGLKQSAGYMAGITKSNGLGIVSAEQACLSDRTFHFGDAAF